MGRRGFPIRETVRQFESVAVRSSTIVLITALFTGMVLALQDGDGARSLRREALRAAVGLAFGAELGPVLTALVVSGVVGGHLRGDRVDDRVGAGRRDPRPRRGPGPEAALPRMLATTLGLPMLTMLANLLGILGGLLIATQAGIGANFYYQSVINVVTLKDLVSGLVKTLAFGWTLSMVACHQGLATTGGTVGVGRATTRTVVVSSIAVLVSDFFLSKLIMMF
ncbi:MAG: ABC transporter permease [Myxococcota bacterium]